VLADGAKLVDRWTVYNKPTTDSHYMALAVKPQADASDTGDFHFWRLDADKTWSYKVCYGFVCRPHTAIRAVNYPSPDAAACMLDASFEAWPTFI
jgi:hypothetical protein